MLSNTFGSTATQGFKKNLGKVMQVFFIFCDFLRFSLYIGKGMSYRVFALVL
jgi:hypothetical protein